MPLKQAIVRGAGDLRQEQHLQFEAHAEHSAALAKRGKAPMRSDAFASQPVHGTAEQPGVLAFLGKPKVHKCPHLRRGTAKTFSVPRDEGGGTATISELKLLE